MPAKQTPVTWTDISSRSQGEAIDSPPRTVKAKHGPVRVVVTRHIHYPGSWTMVCDGILPDRLDLDTDDLDRAKAKALDIVLRAISQRARKLDDAFRALISLQIETELADDEEESEEELSERARLDAEAEMPDDGIAGD